MKKLFLYGCAVTAFSLSLSVALRGIRAQEKKTEATRTLAGVQLSPATTKLLAKVEALYGVPVRIATNSNMIPGAHGREYVNGDGTPVIELDPRIGMSEEIVVHELMHLLLWAEGVRDVILVSGEPEVRSLIFDIDQQVLHAYFFPRIRDMGLDPNVSGKADMQWVKDEHQPRYDVKLDELGEAKLGIEYFTCVAVLQDEEYGAALEKNGFPLGDREAGRRGRAAVALTKRNFSTPEEELSVFIGVSNILLEGVYHLSVMSVDDHKRGKFTMKEAKVNVERVAFK